MASFVRKEGRRLLVVRPKDVALAKTWADRALAENFTEEQFNEILTTQPYTVVGFLGRGVGGKHIVIDKDGWKLGEMESYDSFVATRHDQDLDDFKPGDPFEAKKGGA